VEQVLEPSHQSAETSDTVHYLNLINNTQSLTSKIDTTLSQVAEIYLQKEIGTLISLGFLQPNDIEALDNKISLNYVS
jgi:hypothetical protein